MSRKFVPRSVSLTENKNTQALGITHAKETVYFRFCFVQPVNDQVATHESLFCL
jgi:hypothetical protein